MRLLVAILAAATLAQSATAQRRCLTAPEAEALALVAMPDIIRETGLICANTLPAVSLVRRTSGPFLAKYERAADTAWPAARAAIVKLSVPEAILLLQSDFARPLLTSLIVPQLVGRVAVADCGTIDRLVTQLEPLPPRNTAAIVVTTLGYLRAEKAKGRAVKVPDLPLCPTAARR